MPASYIFKKRGSGKLEQSTYDGSFYYVYENESLSTVDELLAGMTSQEVQEKRYCWMFDILVECCFAALMRMGGSAIGPTHVDFIEGFISKEDRPEWEKARFIAVMRWALLHRWEFEAWR